MNEIFFDNFKDRDYADASGNINRDLVKGKLEGGLLRCEVDDKRLATITYQWHEQRISLSFFVKKYKYIEQEGNVELTRLLL